MSPFDFRGPDFLLFYGVLCGAVAWVVVLIRGFVEGGDVPRLASVDPYLIACLRGGVDEAIKTATLSLMDRGLLKEDDGRLVSRPGAAENARRRLEKAILEAAAAGDLVTGLTFLQHPGIRVAAHELVVELGARRLIVSKSVIVKRVALGLVALGLLWVVAGVKIAIALSRGRTNIGFLELAALGAGVPLVMVLRARRTTLGDRLLADLRELFKEARGRASLIPAGGVTQEAVLLAAVFGTMAVSLPGAWAASVDLFPPPVQPAPSPGSGTGSGCGGGGCGGGCGGGGCGGCGG